MIMCVLHVCSIVGMYANVYFYFDGMKEEEEEEAVAKKKERKISARLLYVFIDVVAPEVSKISNFGLNQQHSMHTKERQSSKRERKKKKHGSIKARVLGI